MLTIKHDLRSDLACNDGVTIRHLADFHLGSPSCDEELVKQLIAENVANHYYTFLLGDLLDVGIVGSKSDVYTQTGTVGYWLNKAVELLQPLADAGLILGMVSGNHENRLIKSAGLDVTEQIAKRLGVDDRYDPIAILAFIQVGHQGTAGRRGSNNNYKWPFTFACHCTHGNGNGTTPGGRANALVRARQKVDADIFLQGHAHHSDIQLGSCLRVNRSQLSVKQVEQVFVCCGSCLEYDGSYGEGLNLAPSDNRYPRVFLHGDKQLAEATL